MSQHKSLLLLSRRGKLEVQPQTTPSPQGKQVLVKVTAAAVNPIDWKIVDTGSLVDDFPVVLGLDGAGIIEALGSEITGFNIGDRVFFQGQYGHGSGTFQQYVLVDSDAMAKTPNNITDDQAATIPSGAVTALMILFQKTGIAVPETEPTATGRPILVLGGSSSVGQNVIQLANLAGFSPIITTASSANASFLKSLGATDILDRNADAKSIQGVSQTPIAFVVDAISVASTQALGVEVLSSPKPRPNAIFSLTQPLDESLKQKADDGQIFLHYVYGMSHAFKDMSIPFWKALSGWVAQGKIVPNNVHVVPGGLAGGPEALDLSRKGVSGVKVVIRPQE